MMAAIAASACPSMVTGGDAPLLVVCSFDSGVTGSSGFCGFASSVVEVGSPVLGVGSTVLGVGSPGLGVVSTGVGVVSTVVGVHC